MARFLTQRLISSFISIIGATLVIFLLVQLHNDPRELYVPDSGYGLTEEQWEMLGEKMGFNDPLPIQYWNWISGAFMGDFGVSLAQQVPVRDIIQNRMRATIELAIGGWAFAILLGIPTGVFAAVKRGTFWDYIARGVAIVGQGAPPFVIGLLLIVIFAVWLQDTPFYLPAAGRPPQFDFRNYILPCVALGWPAAAGLMRLTRSAMLEVLDSEFVKLARAKGVGWNKVIYKHALKNALITPLTSALLLFSGWLNGALVIEIIFGWPGIGYDALFTAVNDNDFPLLQGTVFFFVIIFVIFALLADLLYTIIDPRVRLTGGEK
jgi:peptide/nickel transport system permease protein|tara:strand:+ start:1073 stop:2035 length:963 start_codon:yes stop_codon:yes gene_type:complete